MTITGMSPEIRQAVDAAILSRMSCRAFTAQPVPQSTLAELLQLSSMSPSGTNTQPWKVYVLSGAARDGLVAKVCAAHDAVRDDPARAGEFRCDGDEEVVQVPPEYQARRRANGWGLYGVLGIARGERERMHAQHQRNYRFFDAPVGMMFTVDRGLGRSSLVDFGMFMQTLMVSARARGLHTCPQGAWRHFDRVVMEHLEAPAHERLVCGLALGHADEADVVNRYRPERVPVDEFVVWKS